MPTMHFTLKTTATSEQFRAGLTDFGPGRAKLFANSKDGYLKVHSLGATDADVTEGSAGIWERLHYDWSDLNHITLTTTDSNTWGGRSGHTYTLAPQPDGTTDVEVVVVREGKNLKGRALGAAATWRQACDRQGVREHPEGHRGASSDNATGRRVDEAGSSADGYAQRGIVLGSRRPGGSRASWARA